MAEIKHETRTAPRVTEELTLSSVAILPLVARRHLLTVVVLTGLLTVLVAYLTIHGWNSTTHELAHLLAHLPKPLRVLIGGARLAHLLDASQ
jgi:hypothetical protein